MAITKNPGFQCVKSKIVAFTYADFTDDTYMEAVDLPMNAIVVGGNVVVTTLFNSGTDDKFSIGDKIGSAPATKTTYAALSADITATGVAATITPTGTKYTDAATVGVVWNGSGAVPTAGAGYLRVDYVVDGEEEGSYEN